EMSDIRTFSFKWSIAILVLVILGGILGVGTRHFIGGTAAGTPNQATISAHQDQRDSKIFSPTPAQQATFTIEPVSERVFRPERLTEG
ncbi:hypothetical protein NL533_32215, partial [Klebsiella pneumoniae]|nr:hypothetical protein [Klebsiella pneumoniae]